MVEMNAWLTQQPRWLQEAARRLHAADELSARDYEELVERCKREASGTLDGARQDSRPLPSPTKSAGPGSTQLRSIEDVVGINALASESKLDFGSESLSIVYGRNGAGKSGYMRLLKHVCDAKARGELLPDVFGTKSETQGCKINFDQNQERRQVRWSPDDGPVEGLRRVAVFDEACARVYVNEEHEAVYEPPELELLRWLVETCDRVGEALASQQRSMPSRLPRIPPEYAETAAGRWLTELEPSTTSGDVDRHCARTPEDGIRLEQLNLRLSGVDPRQRAAEQRGTVRALETLKSLLEDARNGLSDASYRHIQAARGKAAASRLEAVERASEVSKGAPVGGVGSEHWRRLWDAARDYSEVAAYPSAPFPVVDADAHCVLCQQLLDSSAVERLTSFEAVAKGDLEVEASGAEDRLQEMIAALPELPSLEDLQALLDRAGIGSEPDREQFTAYVDALRPRLQYLVQPTAQPASLPPGNEAVMAVLQGLTESAKKQLHASSRMQRELTLGNWSARERNSRPGSGFRSNGRRFARRSSGCAPLRPWTTPRSSLAPIACH